MKPVTVSAPRHYIDHGWQTIAARITIEGRRYNIRYRSSQGPLASGSEPFAVAALLPAMALGIPLRLEQGISPRMIHNLQQVQDIISTWYSEYQRIPIQAGVSAAAPAAPDRAIACFYSGGVDSSYTVLKRRAEIERLVFIHGFDIRLSDTAFRTRVSGEMRQAAAEWGKPLIEVETNVRDLLDGYCDWDRHSHGAALAGVALALSPQIKKMFIASDFAYDQLTPLGSHPLLTPLWGAEHMQMAHDGSDVVRWEKLEYILHDETVRQRLRACWRHPNGQYNCGECRKCVRILVCLRLFGLEGQVPTFEHQLDIDGLAHTPQIGAGNYETTEALICFAESRGGDPAVIAALRASLACTTPEQKQWFFLDMRQRTRAIARLEARLNLMLSSRSWRWTAPLRAAARVLRSLERRPS